MDILDMLRRSGGIDAVSKQLAIPPADARAGVEALLPAVLGGFVQQRDRAGGGEAGLAAVIRLLDGHGGGSLAADVMGPNAADITSGNAVLGEIFGSKDVSRSVAAHGAQASGIDDALLRRMLPLLAMLVGGYLSARAGSGEGQGGVGRLGAILNAVLAERGKPAEPAVADMPEAPALRPILDIGRRFTR